METNWYTQEWLGDKYWICKVSYPPEPDLQGRYLQVCTTKSENLQLFWNLPMNRYIYNEFGKKEPVKYLKEIITGCRIEFICLET